MAHNYKLDMSKDYFKINIDYFGQKSIKIIIFLKVVIKKTHRLIPMCFRKKLFISVIPTLNYSAQCQDIFINCVPNVRAQLSITHCGILFKIVNVFFYKRSFLWKTV